MQILRFPVSSSRQRLSVRRKAVLLSGLLPQRPPIVGVMRQLAVRGSTRLHATWTSYARFIVPMNSSGSVKEKRPSSISLNGLFATDLYVYPSIVLATSVPVHATIQLLLRRFRRGLSRRLVFAAASLRPFGVVSIGHDRLLALDIGKGKQLAILAFRQFHF